MSNPAPPNMYYVYILKSLKSNWVYIGYTSDLDKRLNEHHSGNNYSTKKYLPLELIYYEAYKSELDAKEREKQLKHYGSSLQKLRGRLRNTFKEGGAG